MLHLKLIISLSFSFLLFIDCFISAKMRILSFILSRKGRFSALERAFSGTLKGVVPKKCSGGQPPNPKFLFASLACPPHIFAAGAAPAPRCHRVGKLLAKVVKPMPNTQFLIRKSLFCLSLDFLAHLFSRKTCVID